MPISSIFQSTSPYSKRIEKIMAYESLPKRRLEDQVDQKKSLKKVLGEVDSPDDGLTYYRDSNSVSDVLEGVTLELKKAAGTQEEFTVKSDEESIVSDVRAFIDEFNEARDLIESETDVDEETKTRGPLAGDYTFQDLRFDLRSDATARVDSQASDEPQFLNDIGIEMTESSTPASRKPSVDSRVSSGFFRASGSAVE